MLRIKIAYMWHLEHMVIILQLCSLCPIVQTTTFKKYYEQRNTDFPLFMFLIAFAISVNGGLFDGSSAQHSFIRVKIPGCTPSDSC